MIQLITFYTACATNCDYCNTNGAGKCDPGKCKLGYTYSSTDQTCKACGSNCRRCDKLGPGNCDYDQCETGKVYDKINNQCISKLQTYSTYSELEDI